MLNKLKIDNVFQMPAIKCMMVGSSCAGKTTLLRTYIDKKFFKWSTPTSYHEYLTKATATNDTDLNLRICDTSGLETYHRETHAYYPNTDVFLICFPVTDPGFYGYIRRRWLPDIRHYCPNAPIVLVGTKVDLREDEDFKEILTFPPLTYSQGLCLAREIGATEYMECSALKGIGVSAIFDVAATCGLNYRYKFGKHGALRTFIGRW